MAAIVVPFRGAGPKARLAPLDDGARAAIALAMLGDVLAACRPVGTTTLVTDDAAACAVAEEVGDVTVLPDPGDGQAGAVAAGLERVEPGPVLVVNADVPCVLPHDLRSLLRATPAGGLALVAADDGTTNALGLPARDVFAPLYGRDSAARFEARAEELGLQAVRVTIPNLCDDVDTLDDLRRVGLRAGPRTQAAIATLGIAA
ncbi:MAG TPA: 2-phospho-L-lactate guanylyltransferase [Gaiellaceae bacterium]|nr:2-phospho-L-lactate guanylyltransferase [Gaiellaceae bacterium]